MSSSITVFNTIVIVGVLQGVVAAVVVRCTPSGAAGKKLLSAILCTLAFLNLKILLHSLGLWQYSSLHYFPLAIDTLIQPLLYLYTCSLTERHFYFKARYLWHFVAVLLFQMHAIIVYGITLAQPDLAVKDLMAEKYLYYNRVKWIEDLIAIFLAGVYWYLSFQKVQNYRRWLFSSQSATQYSELSWLRNLLIGTGILVAVLFLSSLSANILQLNDSFRYLKVFYIYVTLLIYFLSFQGYRTLFTTEIRTLPVSENETEPFNDSDMVKKGTENQENLLAIQSALTEIMEADRLFLEPELSLKELAQKINVPMAQVSAAINTGFRQNFRSWVNSYRVEEVKKRLADPVYKHLSITGIAFDCGFNSEASFYRIFRAHTGKSPKTYLQLIKRNY